MDVRGTYTPEEDAVRVVEYVKRWSAACMLSRAHSPRII